MALELHVVPDGTRTIVPVGSIAPGDFASFEDHTTEPPRLISIGCDPDNGGGAVYGIDPRSDILDLGGNTGTLIHASLHNENTFLCRVDLNTDYELPIRLARGIATLIIEHTDEY